VASLSGDDLARLHELSALSAACAPHRHRSGEFPLVAGSASCARLATIIATPWRRAWPGVGDDVLAFSSEADATARRIAATLARMSGLALERSGRCSGAAPFLIFCSLG